MVSTQPPALPSDTGKQYLLYLQMSIILLYKPCLKYPLDTGQLEILLQLRLSPKLGGFYKRGEIVFAKQTQADMPPFLTYFMPRHTTLHTTLEQFLHFQTPTHPNPYLPNIALFFNQPPCTITKKNIILALDKLCQTGQSKSGTSSTGSGATLATSPSSSSQVGKRYFQSDAGSRIQNPFPKIPYTCFLIWDLEDVDEC